MARNVKMDARVSQDGEEKKKSLFKDIFTYFDAPLICLTATPKDEIDENTYSIFDLEAGVPTYGYELAQAVKDGFLVDFMSVESSVKFLEQAES